MRQPVRGPDKIRSTKQGNRLVSSEHGITAHTSRKINDDFAVLIPNSLNGLLIKSVIPRPFASLRVTDVQVDNSRSRI